MYIKCILNKIFVQLSVADSVADSTKVIFASLAELIKAFYTNGSNQYFHQSFTAKVFIYTLQY